MRASATLAFPQESFLEIPFEQLPAKIGRALDAKVNVPDRWVSRYHCQIELADETVIVRDLGSSHGTYVNGHRVDQEKVLKSGDRLGVGLTSFVAVVDQDRVALELASAG